ncbi:hypothetical protein ACN28E_25070 [Archangium lansingense]|uniref:hypothetical protein n=1 Tax=Archangium lansingense TaxID=2995310 RepID=UPI003B7F802D
MAKTQVQDDDDVMVSLADVRRAMEQVGSDDPASLLGDADIESVVDLLRETAQVE